VIKLVTVDLYNRHPYLTYIIYSIYFCVISVIIVNRKYSISFSIFHLERYRDGVYNIVEENLYLM